jgi:N-acetylglucosamine malate deacetylase 1
MNPYLDFVTGFSKLVSSGRSLPLGGIPRPPRAAPQAGAPVVLVFSPHPDDECIVAGLALRLLRECGARVINVAVTQGSNKERQPARLQELRQACEWLGFEVEQTAPNGLEKISPKSRAQDPSQWAANAQVIARCLSRHQPRLILFPHDADFNSTHVGTHHLVLDALQTMPSGFQCRLVETEFWAQMTGPNLMVELSPENVADMLAALSFHVGEVQRNPYHLSLPAWLFDNVRRGAEVVGGQGGAAPDYHFATLYRVRQWKNGAVAPAYAGGCILTATAPPTTLLRDEQ